MQSNYNFISPLDNRYKNQVEHLSQITSEYGLTKYRLIVEIKWLQKLLQILKLNYSSHEISLLEILINNFDENTYNEIKQIENITSHDVKAIEYYIKNYLEQNNLQLYNELVHFACTSEDINNISYALMIKEIKEKLLLPIYNEILTLLKDAAHIYKDVTILSRTHGQAATPTTIGKEIANFNYRITRQINQFNNQPILAKMNGTVGNYNAHTIAYSNINWLEVCKQFINQLGLEFNPYTTQIEPSDYIAEICDNVRRINNILINFNQDIWYYLSLGYFKQKLKPNEIGSSIMPHKVNPIDFENSEGNLGVANSLLMHFSQKLTISRLQRDLTDSTVKRNIGVAFGHCYVAYKSLIKGLNKLEVNLENINKDLHDNPQVIAEAVQTLMRKYNLENAYEELKALTRGNNCTLKELHTFIINSKLPQFEKDKLLALKVEQYVGLAPILASNI